MVPWALLKDPCRSQHVTTEQVVRLGGLFMDVRNGHEASYQPDHFPMEHVAAIPGCPAPVR